MKDWKDETGQENGGSFYYTRDDVRPAICCGLQSSGPLDSHSGWLHATLKLSARLSVSTENALVLTEPIKSQMRALFTRRSGKVAANPSVLDYLRMPVAIGRHDVH
jgi:hypothetical protein